MAFPRDGQDVGFLVSFAREHQIGLIPRTAGTSLAGQVVGSGLVVDFSRYLNQILEVDVEARTVRVQPGVIRNELNLHLEQFGLLFGPETSTSNRAMVGVCWAIIQRVPIPLFMEVLGTRSLKFQVF